MTEILLRPLADSFMQVGVFVALLVAPFGWARARWGQRLDAVMLRHRRLGPPVAAALTMPPGCGGAIVVMALYARGGVSFGAAVAALVATMGDASWVLLAADPLLTVQLKLALLAIGTVTGWTVDALGIAPARRRVAVPAAVAVGVSVSPPVAASAGAGGSASSPVDPGRVTAPAPDVVSGLLWAVLAVGLALSLPVTFQLVDPAALGRAVLGGLDPYLAVGVLGWAVTLAFMLRSRQHEGGTPPQGHPSSVRDAFAEGGGEIATVTVWVSVAYVTWSVLTATTGFDGSQLPLLGLTGVVIGALIGLVPGCAVQIVFAGIFAGGGMPLPTFLANTISQDGDALLPLLAMESRSALVACLLTTVPALLVGGLLLLLT